MGSTRYGAPGMSNDAGAPGSDAPPAAAGEEDARSQPAEPAPEPAPSSSSLEREEPTASEATTEEALSAELARVRAERDEAVAALDKEGKRTRRRARARSGVVGVLVVIFSILVPLTFVASWAHYVVLNENGWNQTIGPLASNPAVTAAVADEVTNQVYAAVNPQQVIADALPDRAKFLAAPIANAAKGYVLSGVTTVVQSSQFRALWQEATSFAHTELVAVLRGKSKAVTTTNGQVVLNLVPLMNKAIASAGVFVSGVTGKPIKLPTVSASDIPASACQRIGTALGVQLPDTCAQIPLFPADKLTQAQRLVRVFDRAVIALLVLTPLVAVVALWISHRRRRTLLQLSLGGLIGLVIARRAVTWLQHDLATAGHPQYPAARAAILTQLLHTYYAISRWFVLGLALVAAVTLLTGPYSWAATLRHWIGRAGRAIAEFGQAAVGKAREPGVAAWVGKNVGLLRIAGIALGLIVLLIASVSFIGFIVVAAIVVLYEVLLNAVAARSPEEATLEMAPQERAERPPETTDASSIPIGGPQNP
jgi:hypothetical protein